MLTKTNQYTPQDLKILIGLLKKASQKLDKVEEENDKLFKFRSQIIWKVLGDVKKPHDAVDDEKIFQALDNIKKSGGGNGPTIEEVD